MPPFEIESFVNRYVSVWNEPDPDARRALVAGLWAPDGVEVLGSVQYRGHQELEARVTSAYEQFVAGAGHVFVSAEDASTHSNMITFRTHMLPSGGGDLLWTGVIFAELDDSGRIVRDVQFAVPIVPATSTRAVASAFLARLGAGDAEGAAELFADKVDWLVNWPAREYPATPWIRDRSTKADMAELFRELVAHHGPDGRAPVVPTVLVDGVDAVLLTEIRQTARATGRGYTAHCALRITVEDGLITRYHVYEDSLSIAEAFA
ncbi:nuclear transport factor 2 family protein [Pseudonocardia spinosispora]|uniref:nuclear transport factor 2 family protein n=1 Tax=Pseudonocardia spinosispora TaxID=103441 RepID=UPI000A05EC8A|nr:nuclear transport factor 2 family protein [Pseudonocardia spinosispora]